MRSGLRRLLGTGLPLLVLCFTGMSTATHAGTAGDKPAEGAQVIGPTLMLAPADGGVRRWQVAPGADASIRRAASIDAPVVMQLPGGALLLNLGCEAVSGAMWCSVRPVRGGARGFTPASNLVPAIGPDGITPMGVDDSRRRAKRRDFDATAKIACAQEQGQSLGLCKAAVARGTGGDATVAVVFPNGFTRQLYFVHGAFVAASATMSGVGTDTDWRVEGARHIVRVDDQRYELPGDFVFGE
ncbi:MAG: hypothetical protein AAF968_05855 [Pseudomonadota bacterium]